MFTYHKSLLFIPMLDIQAYTFYKTKVLTELSLKLSQSRFLQNISKT